jgi:hypothetical protein
MAHGLAVSDRCICCRSRSAGTYDTEDADELRRILGGRITLCRQPTIHHRERPSLSDAYCRRRLVLHEIFVGVPSWNVFSTSRWHQRRVDEQYVGMITASSFMNASSGKLIEEFAVDLTHVIDRQGAAARACHRDRDPLRPSSSPDSGESLVAKREPAPANPAGTGVVAIVDQTTKSFHASSARWTCRALRSTSPVE